MAERVRRATERSHHRHLASTTAPVRWSGQSQYIASYSIGHPPQPAEAIVDSGSDLIWTQCSSCRPRCFSQNLPYYNFSTSSTAGEVPCNGTGTGLCGVQPETKCARGGASCAVNASYGAGLAIGVLGTEVFTFRLGTATLAFGCISANTISAGALDGASGIIGLGRGALSLLNQLGDTKFSYCFTPYFRNTTSTSHLFVGSSARLRGGGAPVTTVPFAKNPKDDRFNSYYYLPLVGLAVGNATLAVPAGAFDIRQVAPRKWAGGAFIDSGTPLTRLVDPAHGALKLELARQLGDSLVPPPADAGDAVELCVASENNTRLPPLVLRFGGGGRDLVVSPANYWVPVDASTWCMVVLSSAGGKKATLPFNETSIIGNFMQQVMHVLYDLANGVLCFQPTDCSAV